MGGTFGSALAVRVGDFLFTTAFGGVTAMEGVGAGNALGARLAESVVGWGRAMGARTRRG